MYIKSFFSTLVVACSFVVIVACSLDEPERSNSESHDNATDKVFEEVQKIGLVINGYKDSQGIARVVEHGLKQVFEDQSNITDQFYDIAERNGIDAGIREIDRLVAVGSHDIVRIEFAPPSTGEKNQGLPKNDLTPSFPSKGSLSGYRVSITKNTDSRGGTYERVDYSDLSSTLRSTTTNGEGNRVETTLIVSIKGVEYFSQTVYDQDTGLALEKREENTASAEMSEAYESDGPSQKGSEENGKEKVSEENGKEKDVDQYQPAEGGDGVFCPLIVESCRRGLEQALSSGQTIFAGVVLINPENPDDQPSVPRLIYDPEDLVVNPGSIEKGGAGSDSTFQMMIPVWVNPPRPGA